MTANQDELIQLQATVDRQSDEIERLRRRLADERLAEDLRSALITAGTAGTISSPVSHSHLLEMVVETAANVISANAASLFLIDAESEELVFEVALGQKAEEVKKFRVPLGHGIAGLVAVSGQPMAISDAQSDPRQASDIAKTVGYAPQSILCVPLMYDDEVIGVLELLDKQGAPSFSPSDMEALYLFANLAAVAIEQSRTHRSVVALVDMALEGLAGVPEYEKQGLRARARDFATRLQDEDLEYRQALDLAKLVHQLVVRGDDEAELCTTILRGFGTYLHARSGEAAPGGIS